MQRELHGEAADWSVTDHLLAAAVDHLAVANWMFAAVNADEDGEQPEPPQPIPRPGDSDEDEDEEEQDEDSTEESAVEAVSLGTLARFFG